MTVISERGMRSAICPQHHVPRRECDPKLRHRQSFRCGAGLWDGMEALGRESRTDRNAEMERALQEWVALPEHVRDELPGIEDEGERRGLRSIRCSDELWDQVAAKARRLGMGNVSDGVRAALRRKAVLSDGPPQRKAKPAPVAADPGKAAVVENLRAKTDEVMQRMKPSRPPAAPVRFEDGTGQKAAW